MSKSLRIQTGSRIHFGLFSVGQIENHPRFGGCGVMVREPGSVIELSQSDSLQIEAEDQKLAQSLVRKWWEKVKAPFQLDEFDEFENLPVSIQYRASAPRHCGFGSGTQNALAIALALNEWFKLSVNGPAALAKLMDRGKRSAIGTFGFFEGGFLVDRGKKEDHELSQLDLQVDFPDWPILLLSFKSLQGVHGKRETAAFRQIPPASPTRRQQMIEIVKQAIAPAVVQGDYDLFGDAVFEYGRTSGNEYAEIQGGDFQSAEVEKLVYSIRHKGVSAVGQSSWGPCVFAVARDDETANQLQQELSTEYRDSLDIIRTQALNRGAEIKWLDLV